MSKAGRKSAYEKLPDNHHYRKRWRTEERSSSSQQSVSYFTIGDPSAYRQRLPRPAPGCDAAWHVIHRRSARTPCQGLSRKWDSE